MRTPATSSHGETGELDEFGSPRLSRQSSLGKLTSSAILVQQRQSSLSELASFRRFSIRELKIPKNYQLRQLMYRHIPQSKQLQAQALSVITISESKPVDLSPSGQGEIGRKSVQEGETSKLPLVKTQWRSPSGSICKQCRAFA